MTRFAGKFSPMELRSGGVSSNAGAAADAVSIANVFEGIRKNSPKYDQIAADGMKQRSAERQAVMNAEAQVKAADIQAEATIAAAEKSASASKQGSMMSTIGSIAGAAIGLSDESTKHTVDTIDDALTTLRSLRPVTFFYKEEYSASPERMHHGFIAQEFQKVVPDATYYDESIGKLCIDTTDLIGLLVRANQQLETRLMRLEAKQALAAV
jgi:dGTP triphosphohydrolase